MTEHMSTMRGVPRLLLTEIRLFLREPMAAFFTLVWPAVSVILFRKAANTTPGMGGRGVDVLVPTMTCLVITVTSLMSIPMRLAVNRERGVLRRLSATPLTPVGLLVGFGGSFVVITVVGILGVVATGAALGASAPAHPLAFAAAALLSCAALFGIGLLIGSVVPTVRAGQAVAPLLLFPMMFLSGMTTPRELLSPTVRAISNWLPPTHAVELLRHTWDGQPGSLVADAAVLVMVTVAAMLASTRLFRWTDA